MHSLEGILLEHSVCFPLAHHLMTVGVKGIVNDPLGCIKFVIVFETQVSKAFGNCLKPWTFGLIPERIVGISSIDDLTKQYEPGVAGQVVFLNYRLEGALFAVMPELHTLHIERSGPEALGFVHNLIGRNEEKFGLLVHELSYEPGTGPAIHLNSFSNNSFH